MAVFQSKNIKGYLTVLSGMCIHIFCGNLYLWGNISPYVISYFHNLGDTAATLNMALLCIPVSWLLQAAANPLGASL